MVMPHSMSYSHLGNGSIMGQFPLRNGVLLVVTIRYGVTFCCGFFGYFWAIESKNISQLYNSIRQLALLTNWVASHEFLVSLTLKSSSGPRIKLHYKALKKHGWTLDALFYVLPPIENLIGDLFILNSYKDKLYIKMLGFSKEIDCYHHHLQFLFKI